MENEQNNKELESLTKRIRFKSLPFDEKQMSDRLTDRVKRPVVISYAGKGNSVWKYLSIAASIALLLVTGALLTDKAPEQELVYYETTAVPDAKTKITLPDSSVVWLNANACLRYPREFSEQIRQVEIKGEAFFEVRKDEKKPFIVQTDGIGIRVLGTTFNVDAEPEKKQRSLSFPGKKSGLYKYTNQSQTADRILLPGERAVFLKSDNKLSISTIRPEKVRYHGVTGIFKFKDNSLADIMQELQRAFHVKIHIQNENLKKQTFNANFTEKETLERNTISFANLSQIQNRKKGKEKFSCNKYRMLNHKDKRLWTVHEKQDLINRETYKKGIGKCCDHSQILHC